MAQATIPTDLYVGGSLSAKSFTAPAGSITDTAVAGATGVQASKLQHQYQHVSQPQDSTASAAVARKVIHVVKGASATIIDFAVGAVTAAIGAATATIDLKKNGSTVLTGTISLDSTTAAFILKTPAGFTSTALVAGDVLEFHITAAAAGGGTLALGVFGRLTVREDAQ